MSATVNRGALVALRARVIQRRDEILLAAGEVMGGAVARGALVLQDTLEDATTKTGYQRLLLHGGFPGRHDTGDMVGSISYSDPNEPFDVEGERDIYAFGWFPGDFEDYFYEQDVGVGNIPPANGMVAGQAAAVQYVRERMRSAVSGG